MRINLLKYVLAPAMMMAAALTTNSAHATTVNVPFSFTVAGHVCPSGAYQVEKQLGVAAPRVTLRSLSDSQSFTWDLRPGDPAPNDTRVILKFEHAGQMHSLASVQYGNAITMKLKDKSRQVEAPAAPRLQGQ